MVRLENYLKEIKKNDKSGNKINAFLQLNPKVLEEAKNVGSKKIKGKLSGKFIGVKSNINVLGLNVSCASKTLENYKAPYDASVIDRIRKEGGVIIGMTNMDEFAAGGSGETSSFGPTKNPRNLKLVSGGSSSGSAAAVSAGFCDMALGSDTGGSIRNPASHCGVVGLKPSYSSVSRYGLIDLSMSLDQIGTITKNVYDAALLLSVIKGKDNKDAISQDSKPININDIEKVPRDITVGLLDFGIQDKGIQELVEGQIKDIAKKYSWKIKPIKFEYINLAIETYYLLVYVEFFSATRKFDGRRYGKKIENFAGPEVLRRILGGGEISRAEYFGRYYNLALKSKKLIEKEFDGVFKQVDCVVSPTIPKLPHKIGNEISVEDMYAYDALTIPSSLAGNCAISIPGGEIRGIPVGIQIIADKFQEQKLLQIARSIEKRL